MNLLLGLRIAFAGGRDSKARMTLTAVGVAIGVTMVLFSLAVLPAMQGRVDRLAWHRTSAASPPTAPDRALWLPTTDRYDGKQLTRIQVAAMGPRPPVPPGMDRLPGAGEVFVSPELARLINTVPADQLGNRFPGRIAGTIRPDGLISPGELVAVVGRTPEELRTATGAYEIRGIEQPGDPLDLALFLAIGVAFNLLLVMAPLMVFVGTVARIGTARREQRFAAIRLAGATRWQTATLAATETAAAGLVGSLFGLCGYLALRPYVARNLRFDAESGLFVGYPIVAEDFAAPAWLVLPALVAVPLVAVAATLVTLRWVQAAPLDARRRVRRPPPRAWRVFPLAAGIAGTYLVNQLGRYVGEGEGSILATVVRAVSGLLALASITATLAGIVLVGPLACMWLSRGLARLSRRAPALIAARRIAADPYTASFAMAAVAVAAYVATTMAGLVAAERAGGGCCPSVLDRGVVAIDVRGTPQTALAPLMSEGAVVARSGSGATLVVRCAELARVSRLTCPLPAVLGDMPIDGMIEPPPGKWGFAEPGPGSEALPVHSLYVPTDGTLADQERVRTVLATVAPYAVARTNDDWARQRSAQVAGFDVMPTAMLAFILLIGACSLTVAAATALLDRRRPFAVLRASGVRLGELRRVVLLEAAAPLLITTLGGMTVAVVVSALASPGGDWAMPGVDFFLAAGAALLVALGVCLLTLPLLNAATRHDSVRFE